MVPQTATYNRRKRYDASERRRTKALNEAYAKMIENEKRMFEREQQAYQESLDRLIESQMTERRLSIVRRILRRTG